MRLSSYLASHSASHLAFSLLLSASTFGCATPKNVPEAAPPEPLPPPPPALETTVAATPVTVCGDPSSHAWEILVEDKAVAVTRGRCLGQEEDGFHFVTQLVREGAADPDYEFHLWLSDAGKAVRAQWRTATVVTDYRWSEEGLVEESYGDRRTLAEKGNAPWIVPQHALYLRELMTRLGTGLDGEKIHHRTYVPQSDSLAEYPIALDRAEGDAATFHASSLAISLTGAESGLGQLAFGEGSVGDKKLYRPLAEENFEPRLPAPAEPRYQADAGLRITPVKVPGTDKAPELAGELVSLASTDAAQAQPAQPAVLFIGGSGPQTRHGIVPGTGIDVGSHAIHDALAQKGFVALRLDDRGVGETPLGPVATPGFTDAVDDVRRALAFLAERPEVDPDRIILVGHGEGALIASIVGAERFKAKKRRRRAAGVVMMAPAGRNLRELVYSQIRSAMEGAEAAEIEKAIEEAKKVHQAALDGKELPASNEAMRAWMEQAFKEDPLARLRKVSRRTPVLAVQGSKDFQNDPKLDFGPVEEAIEKKSAKGSDARLFDGLDHLFKAEGGRSTPAHYADLRRAVDPAFISYLLEWAGSVTAPKGSKK